MLLGGPGEFQELILAAHTGFSMQDHAHYSGWCQIGTEPGLIIGSAQSDQLISEPAFHHRELGAAQAPDYRAARLVDDAQRQLSHAICRSSAWISPEFQSSGP